MKTTINIPDDLYVEAKKSAAEKRVTLGWLVEEAVREFIREGRGAGRPQFELADGSFKGKPGLQPFVDPTDWSAIRELIYEGRGS